MNILFIHGWGGKRTHYWMPWLQKELEALGHTTISPQIPNSYNPKKDKWVRHIKEYVDDFMPDVVVTHSIGALAWWHFQEQYNYALKAQLFVAPPTHASFTKIESFFPLPTQFNLQEALVIAAEDDTNIDTETLLALCAEQKIPLEMLRSGGHFDPFSKQLTLPLALAYIVSQYQD